MNRLPETSQKLLFLGYPIDRVPKDSLEAVLGDLLEQYKKEHRPLFATTLNALFMGQLSGPILYRKRNFQVSETLREADFIGLDSPFLQFVCKLLGNSIDTPIPSEDLLAAAASFGAKNGHSLFLMGGKKELCEQASKALREEYPRLKIAGIASSSIYTKGPELLESCQRDNYIIDMINAAKPSILIIQLGHPKQEIWFDRIKDRIKVPLSIGIAGGFENYLKTRTTSPNLELNSSSWHKIKRRITSFFHYAIWLPPLFIYNTLNRLLYDLFYKRFQTPRRRQLFLSDKESLSVIPFSPFLSSATWAKHPQWIEEALEHDNIIIDMTPVRHIDPAGLGLIYTIWKQSENANKNLLFMGVSSDVKLLMKLHGAWDFISNLSVADPEEALSRLSVNLNTRLASEREFVSIYQTDEETTLSFFGRLDKMENSNQSLKHLEPILLQKGCTVSLKYCSTISNEGFAFLLKLQELLKMSGFRLKITEVPKPIMHQFKENRLQSTFTFE